MIHVEGQAIVSDAKDNNNDTKITVVLTVYILIVRWPRLNNRARSAPFLLYSMSSL